MKNLLIKESDNQYFYVFLCVFSTWIVNRFEIQIQDQIATIFLLTTGLFHGIFDLDIASINGYSKAKTFFVYILSLGLGILMILWVQSIAVILLLLISAMHFGEDFLIEKKNKTLYSLLIGINILLWFFALNWNEFLEYIALFGINLNLNNYYLIGLNSLLSLFIWRLQIRPKWYIINVILIILLSFSCRLIPAFAIYFCLGHSLPSSQLQVKTLKNTMSFTKFRQVLARGVSVYVLALLFSYGTYLAIGHLLEKELSLTSLVYLMLLSVPHSVIMHSLEEP